jgi:NAD(P)-dependent dehydrogenase (short-subunit alcohol dehydrogenase family)
VACHRQRGASGIGLGVARALSDRGALVSSFDIRPRESHTNAEAHFASYALDVTDAVACEHVFAQAVRDGGAPQLVFHSAGVGLAVPFEELEYEQWDRVLRVNLYGARNVCAAALPFLQAGCQLALMGSLAGFVGTYGYAAYSASKFGVLGLAEVLRIELKPRRIAVSVVCPPEVETPMVAEERKIRPEATTAMKRFAGLLTVEETTRAIVSGLEAGRYLILPGLKGQGTYLLSKLLPVAVSHYIADRIVMRVSVPLSPGRR